MPKFIKGDVVETPFDARATVNWCSDGKVGVDITEYGGRDDSGVYNEAECTLIKRTMHVPRTKKPIDQMTTEELKAELEALRGTRKSVVQAGHKKKRKPSTKRSTRAKGKKKKTSKLDKLSAFFSPEEMERLKEKARQKKN